MSQRPHKKTVILRNGESPREALATERGAMRLDIGLRPMRGAKAAALNSGTPLKGAGDERDLVRPLQESL